MISQMLPQEGLDLYVKEVAIPVPGAKHYCYRFEFDKSRGQIHLRMVAILADKQPLRLLHEIRNGGAHQAADARPTRTWGSLSLTAMRPTGRQYGELDIAPARAPDGEWVSPQDSAAPGLFRRDATSFRKHCIARTNSYCLHTCVYYYIRAPSLGDKLAENGGIRRECRMGESVEATP